MSALFMPFCFFCCILFLLSLHFLTLSNWDSYSVVFLLFSYFNVVLPSNCVMHMEYLQSCRLERINPPGTPCCFAHASGCPWSRLIEDARFGHTDVLLQVEWAEVDFRVTCISGIPFTHKDYVVLHFKYIVKIVFSKWTFPSSSKSFLTHTI